MMVSNMIAMIVLHFLKSCNYCFLANVFLNEVVGQNNQLIHDWILIMLMATRETNVDELSVVIIMFK